MPTVTAMPDQANQNIDFLLASMPPQSDQQPIRDLLKEAIGASAWEQARGTFEHRRRGQDTLTWGDPSTWIRLSMMQCMLEAAPREKISPDSCLEQYHTFQEALAVVRRSSLQSLEPFYSFRNRQAVAEFLHEYPDLEQVLLEAYPYLEKHFGPEPRVRLEVIHDPEVADEKQLFAYILTSASAEEALAQLDKLDEEWFLDQFDQVGDLFNFNLEAR